MSEQAHKLRDDEQRGLLAWFVDRRVLTNLIFGFLIVAGLLSITRVKLAVFPEINPDIVSIEVPYPGANPTEVESGILTRIEDAVDGIEGIREVNTTAAEGPGSRRSRSSRT
jgi:multidrug efflux pump subunit AcrB